MKKRAADFLPGQMGIMLPLTKEPQYWTRAFLDPESERVLEANGLVAFIKEGQRVRIQFLNQDTVLMT